MIEVVRDCSCGASFTVQVVTSQHAPRLCPDCLAEQERAKAQVKAEKAQARVLARVRERVARYGITVEELVDMVARQDGKCPICLEPVLLQNFAIDHDHGTGAVRGVLHPSCNTALGFMGDDADRCERAMFYLRKGGV